MWWKEARVEPEWIGESGRYSGGGGGQQVGRGDASTSVTRRCSTRRYMPYPRLSAPPTSATRATRLHGVLRLDISAQQAQMDRAGPGKTFARAIVEIAERLEARRCSVTLRWTPAHRGVEGNVVANDCARVASKSV